MNQEATDFASHRFTPRTTRGPEHSCAVEHYAPQERRIWRAIRAAVCLLAAAGIGALLSRGV